MTFGGLLSIFNYCKQMKHFHLKTLILLNQYLSFTEKYPNYMTEFLTLITINIINAYKCMKTIILLKSSSILISSKPVLSNM